jgi:hypothetical protein
MIKKISIVRQFEKVMLEKDVLRLSATIILLFISNYCYAQEDRRSQIHLSGYLETYYSHDFSNPFNNEKPDFNYNYKKHNQLNINLAFIKASFQNKQLRSNLALMTGNYAMYNLSAEPNWAKRQLEANVGYKPFKDHNFWIDAGVMPSHIGFESAIGSDCWNLTRSILAENSPYYETGLKFSYNNKKQDLYFAFHVLNGWQKIELSKLNQKPSVGTQITYKASNTLTLNYSNFIGNIKLGDLKKLRTFHNLYGIYEVAPKLSFIFGFDIGTQKGVDTKTQVWYTPVVISKINLSDKSKIAGRLEYYNDKNQVIITTSTTNGYQTLGASINYDYQIAPKVLFRSELKKYRSKDPIFRYTEGSNNQTAATMALIVKL